MRQQQNSGSQRKRSFSLLGLAFVLALLPSGVLAQSSSDRIALSVNGDIVTEAEFSQRLQRLRAQDFIISVNPLQVNGMTAGQMVIDSLINERLILQWAAKTNQMPSEAEVKTETENAKRQPGVQKDIVSGSLSEELVRSNIRVTLARFNIATTAVSLSAREIEDYYKAHLASYTQPEQVGIAILRTSKATDVPKIQAALKARKPFSELVKTYSEDTRTRDAGGQLPLLSANDPNLPAPLREAIKKLRVGDVTPPIKLEAVTVVGQPAVTVYLIVRLTSRDTGSVRPFAEVKTLVERTALLERAGGMQVADKKIAEYRKSAKIEIKVPGYDSLLPDKTK